MMEVVVEVPLAAAVVVEEVEEVLLVHPLLLCTLLKEQMYRILPDQLMDKDFILLEIR